MSNVSLIDGHIDEPRMTNYDRIKSMNVDEVVSMVLMLNCRVQKYPNARIKLVKQWLLQEVSDEK